MRFRDLRDNKTETPVYATTVVVRADIALDRAFCLDEVEAKGFIRNRINEIAPDFKIKRVEVNHRGRHQGASLWETELALQGNVGVESPIPKPEIQKMVQSIVKKAGFENAQVDVRGTNKVGTTDKPIDPDERDFAELSNKALRDRIPSRRRMSPEAQKNLKPGDRVVVSRAGFTEEGNVLNILKDDDLVQVEVASSCGPVWIPTGKVIEVLNYKHKEIHGKEVKEQETGFDFSANLPIKEQLMDGELDDSNNNVFVSNVEFRSRVVSESELAGLEGKKWETEESFESDFPGALDALIDQAKDAASKLGEQEVGSLPRQVGSGEEANRQEAPVRSDFEESEIEFNEACVNNGRVFVNLSVRTPSEIGDFKNA